MTDREETQIVHLWVEKSRNTFTCRWREMRKSVASCVNGRTHEAPGLRELSASRRTS